jgi:hypothetical protein
MGRVAPRPNEIDAGAARLLGLLLVDALQTMALGRRAPGARETRQWICAPRDSQPYSFDLACETYGLPPRALRRRLGLRAQGSRRVCARGWNRGGK